MRSGTFAYAPAPVPASTSTKLPSNVSGITAAIGTVRGERVRNCGEEEP